MFVTSVAGVLETKISIDHKHARGSRKSCASMSDAASNDFSDSFDDIEVLLVAVRSLQASVCYEVALQNGRIEPYGSATVTKYNLDNLDVRV